MYVYTYSIDMISINIHNLKKIRNKYFAVALFQNCEAISPCNKVTQQW